MSKTKLPRVVISDTTMAVLERLAEGLERRNPDLAEHFVDELSRAKVVKSAALPFDTVDLGSTVTFRDETTGKSQTVTLALPENADLNEGRISVATPIGVALIGLSAGAKFSWLANTGAKHELLIEDVQR
ncbi:nucleoside diphosphate kinase regulator [Ketogulonicigenium vulgare]|uniref:nucleoside diphosphate kinase regulator n=1 Tax=Ketogulonicigenium vulgare TaxID=92945 RepID=UPI0023591E0D|nr:nucleoside diphosphate kinase regulator [Ketogulonicigenium vulgare]